MSQKFDENVLILGSSAVDPEFYAELADAFSYDMLISGSFFPLIARSASNPNATKEYVESIKDDPEKEKKIYQRALSCIDKAEFIIVDISFASTGMGLEVGYLLSQYLGKKRIVFIAKEGSKISPHIAGMYEHISGEKLDINFYKDTKDAIYVIESSSEYGNYCCELNH